MINTKLDILKYPHSILTTPSHDIDIMGDARVNYLDFIDKMMEMYNGGSEWGHMVGLAAPQVGQNWNIFVAMNQVFINPVITPFEAKGFCRLKEGCYSLEKEKYDYPTIRWYKIRMKWLDINGEEHEQNFFGQEAQVLQHEYDHLQGKLCIHYDEKETGSK